MAKDLYKSRQMYQSPWLFYLLIPVGSIALILLVDFIFKIYYNSVLQNDTKEVLYLMMEDQYLEDVYDYQSFAERRFEELGYNLEECKITVMFKEKYIIMTVYRPYFTVIGELFSREKDLAMASFKGSYNEYKETVVEKYTKEDDDELFEVDDNLNDSAS